MAKTANNHAKKDTQPTILVVDDDQSILEVIQIILEDKGYQVITCDDSAKVRQLIVDSEPAMVLLDIWMPGLDGKSLTTQLKQDPKTKGTPVVIISALNETEKIAQEVGADDFLAKPFDINNLVQMVEKHVAS